MGIGGGGAPGTDPLLVRGAPAPGTDPLLVPGAPAPGSLAGSRRSKMFAGPRGVVASSVSTVVVFGLLLAAVLAAPGSRTVRHDFLDPHYMWQSLVGDPNKGFYSVGSGFLLNIELCLIAEVLILVLGLALALVRLSRSPVMVPFRLLGTAYSDVFRGVPLILVIYAVGTGLPGLYLHGVSYWSLDVYAVVALVLCYVAYVSEVFRAGIQSVSLSQVGAARSLGLSHWQATRFVVLPQAIRTVIPPLLNDFISLQKDTAIVSILGVEEAIRNAQIHSSTVFNYSAYTTAAILFLLITIPLTRFTDWLIARDRAKRLATGW
jgi:polar amino acid transport system permease protein